MKYPAHLVSLLRPLLVMLIGVYAASACSPAETETVSGSKPMDPPFRSAKRVSTDCGVRNIQDPPPGFARPPGLEAEKMPPPIQKNMSVGADRQLQEIDYDHVSDGYVLIEPGSVRKSFLVNNDKQVVAEFEAEYFGGFTQLLPNGNRLVSSNRHTDVFKDGGGYRGCVEEYSASGKLIWRLNLSTDNYIHHHDVIKMENGNILAVVWERVSTDEIISQGRDPELVAKDGNFWYDGVIEVNPFTQEIVWEWSARHHLIQDFDGGRFNYGVVADHPELLNVNLVKKSRSGEVHADWTHVNAMDYNAERDQILLSSNYLSEIWIIDHSTTAAEAIGHTGGTYGKGGDFIYRWGNPENYDRGTVEDRKLYHQHDSQWIRAGLNGAGNILIFNNGESKLRPYSTVVEFLPPVDSTESYIIDNDGRYGPETLVWEYDPDPSERFFSFFISGAQRLANGNTLVTQGAGAKVREVTHDGKIVWDYAYEDDIDAPHMLFRANRYAPDHPGIADLIR